jgi:hypothetical protein
MVREDGCGCRVLEGSAAADSMCGGNACKRVDEEVGGSSCGSSQGLKSWRGHKLVTTGPAVDLYVCVMIGIGQVD